MKYIIVIGLLIHWMTVHAATDQRETILWPVNDFPPSQITSGPYRGQGAADRRREILIRQLSEFRHEVVEVPITRILEMFKTRPNVCLSNALKTAERETFMEFSAPSLRGLPNGIITTRNRLPLLKPHINERGELRLDDFLSDGKFRLAIVAGRSFSPGIDPILKKHAQGGAIVVVPSSDHMSSRLLKLLDQKEFDTVIGYANELRYLTRQLNLNERDFVLLPVAGEPSLLVSYIACSKSPLGKRIISMIDHILIDQDVQREINVAYRNWLDDETAVRFDDLLKQAGAGK